MDRKASIAKMKRSVPEEIINSWLDAIAEADIDPEILRLLRELAASRGLGDQAKLKQLIVKIEELNAKDQNA